MIDRVPRIPGSITAWTYNDGGRAAAGYRGTAGDCVCRALTIGSGLPYREVYRELAAGEAWYGRRRSARDGVDPTVYKRWLADNGWRWTPTMKVGTGCTVHLTADELPAGRLIVRLSGHLTAVIDGVIHDTHDPSRDGTRCVYGYWQPGRALATAMRKYGRKDQ